MPSLAQECQTFCCQCLQPRVNRKGVDASLIGSDDDEDYGSDEEGQDDNEDDREEGSSVVREPSNAPGSERSSQDGNDYQPPGVIDTTAGEKNDAISKPIRPKKTHKHGTKRWQLHELVMNTLTLGSGVCQHFPSKCAEF
jgi:hypothetical protein